MVQNKGDREAEFIGLNFFKHNKVWWRGSLKVFQISNKIGRAIEIDFDGDEFSR